jgi:hypothetical protein
LRERILPNYRDEKLEFDVELKDETDKAWLVVFEDEEYWVPKSIAEWKPSSDDVSGVIEVPTWWAAKEHLA